MSENYGPGDTNYTMGGLDSLPASEENTATDTPDVASYLSRAIPNISFDQFTGGLEQISQLFPGIQIKPNYQPGLTDITFTRGFYGPQQDVTPSQYGTESAGHLFWSPQRYQLPVYAETTASTTTSVSSEEQQQDQQSDQFLRDIFSSFLTYTSTAPSSGDSTGGSNVSDSTITDDTKTTTKDTTSTVVDGGLTNLPGGSTTTDSQIIDFDIGTRDPGTVTDTVGGGTVYDTVTGGEGNDTSVVTGPTEAELEAKAAREQTVKNAYQQVFGRTDVDQEGLDYWTGQLASGKSSTDLLRDLVSGAQGADIQAAQNTDTVSKLYQDLLDRAPDAEGLSYFRSQLAAGATPEEVAQNIISGARANEEASKISQAEYDRYFKQPEDTSATSQNAADSFVNSFINEDTIRKELSSQITAERAGKLRELATDYYNNNIMSANFSPEDFRDGFFYEVATTQPELISDLVGEATTSKYLAEFSAGEGVYNVGIDYNALSKDLTAALDTNTYAQYANNVDDLVESGNLANVFDAYQAEMDAAVLSEFIDVGGAELIGTLISGDNLSEVVSGAVTNYLVRTGVDMASSALASLGIPGAGPFISAALMLDGILSEALGYDSPIQDGVGWISKQVTKGVEWVENVFGDIFGNIGDFFGGLFAEGGMVRYQDGGLVDLPSEMPYSYTNYYGALDQSQPSMPQLSLDEVQPEMAFAGGGIIPLLGGGKIARGPGGGLDDLIPTSIDGKRAAALSDGEFVIPADVVSMMGDGSSNAGAKRLYDMVRQVRQSKTGTTKQAGPLPTGKILERVMR
jgi:hypothetical protein